MARAVRVSGLLLGWLVAGCGGGVSPAADSAALRQAPTEVAVQGRAYRLETYLWRDFMPVTPPGGRPLIAVVRIIAADGRAVAPVLQADRMWVLFGEQIWETALGPVAGKDPERAHQLERIARDGPKWPPGERVTVVVRLVGPGGASHLLRAADQRIHRTM